LLLQYFDNSISSSDCAELMSYLKDHPEEAAALIDEQSLLLDQGPEFSHRQSRKVLDDIKADVRFIQSHHSKIPKTRIVQLFQRFAKVAAVIAVLSGAGFYFICKYKFVNSQQEAALTKPAQILPGTDKAVLTLADGKVIVLDHQTSGTLVKSREMQVNNFSNGKLVYQPLLAGARVKAADNSSVYNTLSTPRGGEYQVILPDGTHVWLNSASSISYPVEFSGRERRVKLKGEAYFEVAKNKDKPFYVSINDVQVKVLGTHFNISAYGDENDVTTTLLEGAVQVNKNHSQCFLKPGQQAMVTNQADLIKVSNVNINEAIAWKNGYFIFNDDNLVTILKKVSRWYDVDVEFRGDFEGQKFGGTFYRTKSLAELLAHIEKLGNVHFKITGRRIIVMK